MGMTKLFRLVVETRTDGLRHEYEPAQEAFLAVVQPIAQAFGLTNIRYGSDEFFAENKPAFDNPDYNAMRLQLYLAINIPVDQLTGHQALALAIAQLIPDVTAWCEPMDVNY